jgi:flavin-dependent dehydrogenase
MCAGVVSETLINKLAAEGIFIPEEKVQRKIDSYNFQTKAQSILLEHPFKSSKIVSVFRGNGPRFFTSQTNISFDDFLLENVKQKGINIISEIVSEIILPKSNTESIKIIYGRGQQKETFHADLVVGAFGLNTQMIEKIKNLRFGYRPPQTVNTCQAEIELDPKFIAAKYKNSIYTFSLGIKNIRYGAIIPKASHITISIIGRKNVSRNDLVEFINHPRVRPLFPKTWRIPEKYCYCYPKIPLGSAGNPFTDRMVLIGDASISRYYKNGLESAFITARLAAHCAVFLGIDKKALKKYFFEQAKKIFQRDNFFGDMLFRLNDLISKSNLVTAAHLSLANKNSKTSFYLQQIYWNMFTGNIPYKEIFKKLFNPILQIMLFCETFKIFIKNAFRK